MTTRVAESDETASKLAQAGLPRENLSMFWDLYMSRAEYWACYYLILYPRH